MIRVDVVHEKLVEESCALDATYYRDELHVWVTDLLAWKDKLLAIIGLATTCVLTADPTEFTYKLDLYYPLLHHMPDANVAKCTVVNVRDLTLRFSWVLSCVNAL
jgi:hypothetical protein